MLSPFSLSEQLLIENFDVVPLCSRPRLYLVRNFLTSEECDHLIQKAIPQKTRCWVVDSRDGASSIQDYRSSSFAFFWIHEDPIITAVEQKISLLTNTPVNHGENLQVIHYDRTQEYEPHHDYFDPSQEGGQKINENGGQRMMSVICYLNDGYGAGETIFPEVNLKVIPKKGNAIAFYNVLESGEIDPMTRHGGLPVSNGEKWIATKWIHERPYCAAAPQETQTNGHTIVSTETDCQTPNYGDPYQKPVLQLPPGWDWVWNPTGITWEPSRQG